MWDSNSPLQLLNSMPERLEEEHLEKLQLLFEADKYKNQLINGFNDMCGEYAPFCNGCNRSGKYPCAVAYVNSMKAEGANVDMAAYEEQSVSESGVVNAVEETENSSSMLENDNKQKSEKTKIRIAIARKKIL